MHAVCLQEQASGCGGTIRTLEALNCEILRREEAEAHVQALSEALAATSPLMLEKETLCGVLKRIHVTQADDFYRLFTRLRQTILSGQSPSTLLKQIELCESAREIAHHSGKRQPVRR